MQLLYSPTSPYARKVRVVGRELRLRIEEVVADPRAARGAVRQLNPLHKVPVLDTGIDGAIFDSRVICAYLLQFDCEHVLAPQDPALRLQLGVREAMAEGLADAAFALVMERRRPAREQSPEWALRWEEVIASALAAAEERYHPGAGFDLGAIGLACALGYLDLRLAAMEWRVRAPRLSEWFATVSSRASMLDTMPSG